MFVPSKKPGSILGRIEDDNFVVFLRDCPDKEERRSMIEDLFRCVHRSYLFGNESSPDISASVGISLYPNDGNSFEQLFEKASRAVEVAKLNGKNMYLYYNSGMQENWELKKIDASLKVQEHYEMEALKFKEFFIPIDSSDGEYILSYDMFGMNTSHIPSIPDIENMVDTAVVSGNITALSLSTIRHLLAAVSRLESEKTALPALSVYLIFDSRDSRSVLTALAEMLKTCAVNTENICLMIPHSTVEQFGIADLSDLVGQIKELGFRVGVFQVGVRNININCFIEGLFDRVDFSANFIHGVRDGVYDPELLPQAPVTCEVPSTQTGYVSRIHAEAVGLVSMGLGGGRAKKEDLIDPAVGVVLHKKLGDAVKEGESLATLHAASEESAAEAAEKLRLCYEFSAVPVERPPFIKKIL